METTRGLIYRATNTVTNKSYIGQTIQTLEHRKSEHIYHSKTNLNDFYKALNEYPNDFIWDIIEDNINYCKLDIHEAYYIGLYDTYNHGYNSTIGGEGFVKVKRIIEPIIKPVLSIQEKINNGIIINFKELCKDYVENPDCREDIDSVLENQIITQAFKVLGPQRISELAYQKDKIIKELSNYEIIKTNYYKILTKLNFKQGDFIASSDIKTKLTDIYNELNVDKKITSSELIDLGYKLKTSSDRNENGVKIGGYKIESLNNRCIYSKERDILMKENKELFNN